MSLSVSKLRRRLAKPVMPVISEAHLPAPTGGLNTISPASEMGPLDCIQLYNCTASEYGVRTRLGSREWCTGLTGNANNNVRTGFGFMGSTSAKNRNFATTSTGIWDVSSSSTSPIQVLAFSSSAGNAGYGVFCAAVTSAGHFLLYCDEVNGYHVYTESTDTWAAISMGGGASQISGVDPTTFRFVFVYKNRVCFAAADSQSLYYLGAASIYGAATAFPLTGQFKNGGALRCAGNWTYDGGSGVDDSLVLISDGGDLVIYTGSDISSANSVALRGVWNIGGIPAGRDLLSPYGGDLLILNRSGALSLSRLVSSAPKDDTSLYATAKISNLFSQLMLTRYSTRGWAIRQNPEDNTFLVLVPESADAANGSQLALSNANRSWSRYRDLPIFSGWVWDGKFYYGTYDGKVGVHDGTVDGVMLADPNSYTAITSVVLHAFNNLGNGHLKKVESIRPHFQSEGGTFPVNVGARYNFDTTELDAPSAGTAGSGDWDSGLWDTAVWGGEYAAYNVVRGAAGIGTHAAIALKFRTTARVSYVGSDVAYTEGGFL